MMRIDPVLMRITRNSQQNSRRQAPLTRNSQQNTTFSHHLTYISYHSRLDDESTT
jgi:hypothetical protein